MREAWRGRRPAAMRAAAGVCALVGVLLALYGATTALAVVHHPTGGYAKFADCPLSDPATEFCLIVRIEGGSVAIGDRAIPISQTITLQSGLHEVSEEHIQLIAAEDGNTVSKTPQPVPGGLLGIVAPKQLPAFLRPLFAQLAGKGLLGLTVTTELAAPAGSVFLNANHLIEGQGVALALPIKVKLGNPLLGEHCYIGSDAHPMIMQLTTGSTSPPAPTEPITGRVGELEFEEHQTIVRAANNSLVDNSFAVPGAEGCGGGLAFLVDPAIDFQLGLPAAAGHNTAIFNDTVYEGIAAAITASE